MISGQHLKCEKATFGETEKRIYILETDDDDDDDDDSSSAASF